MRPATSSDFSGLLAPGVPLGYSLSAVDLLLNSGPLSFRCGEHPVPDIECSHASPDETDDGTDEGMSNERTPGDTGGDASNGVVGGSVRSNAISGKWLGGSGVSQGSHGGVVNSGFPSGEADVVDATRALREIVVETRLGKPLPEERSALLLKARKVEVFENLMAKRGFEEHELVGLTSWLANSTLALLAPGVRVAPGIEEWAVAPSVDEGVSTIPEGRGTVSMASVDDAPASGVTSFVFHRAFGADSGLPVPDVEGNSSSLAAAVSVLLILGDGPERGNSFPPITHATL